MSVGSSTSSPPPHAIAWNVGTDVDIVAGGRQRLSRLRHGEQRAGFGIALAEVQEVAEPA